MAEKYYIGFVNHSGFVTGVLGIYQTMSALKKACKPIYKQFWLRYPCDRKTERKKGLSFENGTIFVNYECKCFVGHHLSKEGYYEWRLHKEEIGEYDQIEVGENYWADRWAINVDEE